MYLETKLNFQEHLNNVLSKVNKTIGLLHKLQAFLPRQSLVTIYKAFIKPHLDYGDIIYDQTWNESFHKKMESIQYNAALATTGAIRDTSREKLYQELQSWPKYMIQTLALVWNSTLQKRFNFNFLNSFLLVLITFSFWEEDWALGYNSMKIWDLLDIS